MIKLLLFLVIFVGFSLLLYFYCKRVNKYKPNNVIVKLRFRDILFLFAFCVPLVLLVTFRGYNVGVDTSGYIDDFLYNDAYFILRAQESLEYFSYGIMIVCKRYFGYRESFFVFGFFALVPALCAIFKLSKKVNPGYLCFLFLLIFYQECFNAVRQMPAVSFVFLSYTFSLEKKNIRFFIFLLIAFLFHSASIFALPIVLFPYGKKRNLRLFLLIVISIAIFISFPLIYKFITNTLGYSRFAIYSNENAFTFDGVFSWFKNVLISLIVLFPIILLGNKKMQLPDNEATFKFVLWECTIVYSLCVFLQLFQNYFFRVGWFYQIGMLVLMSYYCSSNANKNKRAFQYIVIAFYIFYFISLNFIRNYETSALTNFAFD